MNFIRQILRLLAPCWSLVLGFGGDSSSTQETKNTDARVVGGDNSQNLSISSGGDTTLTMTDHGAVSGAMSLAMRGIEAVQTTASSTIDQNAALLEGVLKHSGQQNAAFTDTITKIENKDTQTLVIAGMVVIGLAASSFLAKRA